MLRTLARLALVPLGLFATLVAAGAIDGSAGGTIVVAVGAVLLIVALRLASGVPVPSVVLHARARSQIDVSVLLAQSDPDAAGHPRPRAPGFAASAA